MSEVILSEKSLLFMDVTPTATTPTWALMNMGIESAEVAYNPEKKERHYIADKNKTTHTTGLAKTLDQEQYAYKDDPVFEFIDDLIYNEKIGSEANTSILQVFIYRGDDLNATTNIPAKVQDVSIAIAKHTVTGGDQLQIGYNVDFNGDPTFGNASVVNGKATFTEGV